MADVTFTGRVRARWQRVGPRAHDAAFMALAALGVLAIVFGRPLDHEPAVPVQVAIASLGVVALWWRRRAPVAVTVIGGVVMLTTGVPIVMGVGVFTVAVRRRDRVLLAVSLGAFGVTVGRALFDQGWGELPANALVAVIGVGFCVAAGAYVGARRALVASLTERAERAERERELRAEQAKVAERARIAREMHDVLAHKVSLIALHAGALEVNAGMDEERVRQSAALIRTTATEAMSELREVLGVLRAGGGLDEELRPQAGADELARVVDASRAAGVRVTLDVDGPLLPDALARTVHRVVQEALTNVHKHARGAATAVTVRGDADRGVTIAVVNHRPVSPDALLPGAGAGLAGLRERVALLGGTLDAGPTADGGWRVAAWLPWTPAPAPSPSSVML